MAEIETIIRQLVKQELDESLDSLVQNALQEIVTRLSTRQLDTKPSGKVYESAARTWKVKRTIEKESDSHYICFDGSKAPPEKGLTTKFGTMAHLGGGFRFMGCKNTRLAVFVAGLALLDEEDPFDPKKELLTRAVKDAFWNAGVPRCTLNVNRVDGAMKWAWDKKYLKKVGKGRYRVTRDGRLLIQKHMLLAKAAIAR